MQATGAARQWAPRRRTAAAWRAALAASWLSVAAVASAAPPSAVEPSVLSMPSGPASTRGLADEASLAVQTGQVTYAVPVVLPAAAADFAPEVGLHYHGALGNGALGVGWSLGVPSVTRSLRHGVPTYGPDDEIEVTAVAGGGRLVQILPGEYRLEGQGQQVRVLGDPQTGFVLDDGHGRRYRFGATIRRGADQRTAAWLLESIEDAAGQRATYRYDAADGDPQLTRIEWGTAAQFALEVRYGARPDVATDLRSGTLIRTHTRIEQLRVISHGEELRAYHLEYDAAARLSRLVRVWVTGRGGRGELPPVSLTYAPAGTPRVFELGNTRNWYVGARGAMLVDLDGDGVADFFQLETGQLKRNLGGTFADAVQTEDLAWSGPDAVKIFDVDGDGRPELVDEGHGDGWRISRLEADHWRAAGRWANSADVRLVGPETVLADINGDGLLDVVHETESWEYVHLGTRDGLADPIRTPALPTDSARLDSGRARWADVNGDGLADVVGLNDSDAQVYLGRGDGTFFDAGRFAYPWGSGYQGPLEQLLLADLDRDGLADLVVHAHGHVAWHAGLAAGGWAGTANTLAPPQAGDTVTIADVDGNGSLDIVWASGWAADLAGSTTAGMLVAIEGGLGGRTELTYESTATQGLAAEQRGEAWTRHIAASVPVCVGIVHHTPGSPDRQLQLDVRDPAWDHRENRFAGFLATSRRLLGDTPATSLVESATYAEGTGEDRVLRGHMLTAVRRDGTGAMPLESEIKVWEAALPAALAAHGEPLLRQALLREHHRHVFDGASEPIDVATTYVHDGENNAVCIAQSGRADMVGDETVVRRRYAASDDPWVRGVLIDARLERPDGSAVTHTRHMYDGGAAPLPWKQVAAGRLRRTEACLTEEHRWVVQEERDYDALGNVTRMVEHGRTRHISYDADGVHAIAETLPVGTSEPLVWRLTWDDVLGQPIALTGPDGARQRTLYDELGRPVGHARGDAPPHAEYAYEWHAPYPRTVTSLHDGAVGERTVVAVADAAGRPLYTALALGGGRYRISQRRAYDARGHVVSRVVPFDVDGIDPQAAPPTHAARETFTYDALGRLREQRLPNGATRTTSYRAFEEEVRESGLAPVRYHRDGLGRIWRTERQIDGVHEVADATYDVADRLISMELQAGQVTQRYTYDSLGRLAHSADPDGGPRTLRYDDRGWLLESENGAGDRVTYGYDAAGRVITRDSSQHTTRYHYDVPRDPAFGHTAGRLAWVEDTAGSADFGYDAAGNLDHGARTIAGERATEHSEYSPHGLLLRSLTDDGVDLTYRYDAAGQLVGIGNLWEAQRLSPTGLVLAERYGNGVTQTFTRDVLGLPTAVQIRSGGATRLDITMRHTMNGVLCAVADVDGVGLDHSATYAYDGAARLVHATAAGHSFEYRYDALQNMVAREVAGPRALLGELAGPRAFGGSPGISGGPRQLRVAGGTTLSYDGAGRMRRAGDVHADFDAFDRMVAVRLADGREQHHVYGYDGERAHSHGDDGETRLFSATVVQRGNLREHRVRADGRMVARIDVPRNGAPPVVTYMHAVLSPGATLITAADGSVRDERRVEAFGLPLNADFAAEAHTLADKPRDGLTGWTDHGARWNAPALAVWTAPDPPGRAATASMMRAPWDAHPYQAMRQSPLLYSDPDGRHPALLLLPAQNRAAIGAAIGGTLAGAVELAIQAYTEGPVNWRDVGASAAGGAVDGAITGANPFRGIGMQLGMAGVGNAFGSLTTRLMGDTITSAQAVVSDAAIGAVVTGTMHFLPRIVGRIYARRASIPKVVARVVPNVNEVLFSGSIGHPESPVAFVTDAKLLEGMNAKDIARFLHIEESPTGFVVREFSAPDNIRVPVSSSDVRFVGGGATAGGAPEWVITNGSLPADDLERLVR